MAGETPEREPILAYLRRLPPGARGVSAAELADHLAATGYPRVTPAGMRRQLVQLQAERLVTGRVVKSGGAMRWVTR